MAMCSACMTSFEQFASHDESRKFEWIDGAIELLPELSAEQMRVRDVLLDELGGHAEANQLGLVIPAPFPVRMPEEMRRAREPDLLFVPNTFVETIQENYVNSHGVTLAIEISDHRTRTINHSVKLREYEQAGIPEYWIVDVEHRAIEIYVRSRSGYQAATVATGGHASRALRGLVFDPAMLWP